MFQAGPLVSIHRPKDRESGRLKNFAFVVFTHASSVPYAIHLTDGIQVMGRQIKAQQRNNVNLPHYLSVGVQSIDCEESLQRTLDGSGDPTDNDYNKYRDGESRRKRGRDEGFRPQPNDPNQVWKNNIDHHAQNPTANRYMSNAMMGGGGMHATMSPSNNHRSSNNSTRGSDNSPALSSRSASHYHQLSNNILSDMSGSGDLRSRLGGNSYRSTRDDRGSGNYGGGRNYNSQSANYGGVNNNRDHYNSAQGYSGNDQYSNAGYYGNQYNDHNRDDRRSDVGPNRMQRRLGKPNSSPYGNYYDNGQNNANSHRRYYQ